MENDGENGAVDKCICSLSPYTTMPNIRIDCKGNLHKYFEHAEGALCLFL